MKKYKYLFILLGSLAFVGACKHENDLYPDPYSGGKQALGIRFLQTPPSPDHGSPGAEVTYSVTGLGGYRPDELRFYLHDEPADILKVTDSTVKIKVPATASTGGLSLYVAGQVFFGPVFEVDGKVSVDPTFDAGTGANWPIYDVVQMPNTDLLMVGLFTDYDRRSATYSINHIVETTIDGQFVSKLLSGTGSNGPIYSIAAMPDGKYIIGGILTSYGGRDGLLSMTRLNANGSLDTMQINVVNPTPEDPTLNKDTVAVFNGGVSGSVVKVFPYRSQVVTVGNFTAYGRYFYERSTHDTKILDQTKINQLVRMNEDGTMDSSFNFNRAQGTGYAGANGFIDDAVLQDDGKVVVVGDFTTFDGKPAGGIMRLDTLGMPDPSFKTGSGADDVVGSITYNAATGKYLLTGAFKHFNGKPYNRIVLLNADGSVDPSFRPRAMEGGGISFAAQLSGGLIIVSGTFEKYDNVTRNGFMILNPDGSLAAGYNNTGDFQGRIMKILETRSALGRPAVLLAGYISKFDGQPVGNLVRIELKP